jgi:hypothetical protein
MLCDYKSPLCGAKLDMAGDWRGLAFWPASQNRDGGQMGARGRRQGQAQLRGTFVHVSIMRERACLGASCGP